MIIVATYCTNLFFNNSFPCPARENVKKGNADPTRSEPAGLSGSLAHFPSALLVFGVASLVIARGRLGPTLWSHRSSRTFAHASPIPPPQLHWPPPRRSSDGKSGHGRPSGAGRLAAEQRQSATLAMSSAAPDRIVVDEEDDDEQGRQYEVQMLVEQLRVERGQTEGQRRSAAQRRGARLLLLSARLAKSAEGAEVLSDDES